MAEIRPDGQYMLWDGTDWNILNGPPGLDGNMTELWQSGAPPSGAPGSRWVDPSTLVEHVWNRDTGEWAPLGSSGGGGSSGHALQDEGLVLPARGSIDFIGEGVTATDDAANNKTIVNITGLGSGLDQNTADGLYLSLDGGTVTGDLFVNGPVNASSVTGETLSVSGASTLGGTVTVLGAATTASTLTLAGDPVQPLEAATRQFVLASAGGQPHTIQDEVTALPARSNLRFAGPSVTVTDDPSNNATLVSMPNPNIIVLGPSDPIPGGTPIGTVVIRTL